MQPSNQHHQPRASVIVTGNPPPHQVRIFLVEDHEIVQEGLLTLMKSEPDLNVVGQATTGEEALGLLPICDPDVVVTDMRLPGMTGIELCREVAERRLRARVVVLSAHRDENLVIEAWQAGAFAYIIKDIDACGLLNAIRTVSAGERILQPIEGALAGRIVGWRGQTSQLKQTHLPAAQQRVLTLVCQGRSNQQIAAATGLSINTVKKYTGRIYRHLEVRGRADAVAEAIRRGLN